MNRKVILAAAAVAGLSLSTPALADVGAGGNGNTAVSIAKSFTSTVGDIGLTYSPSANFTKT
jgi:hypothetical protein